MNLQTEKYEDQVKRWPQSGKHVLAQYDDVTIVVYQAYRPAIAKFAVANQVFGGEFSFSRMSWIKPNFLWMMFRSGWALKPGQEHVLAVRIAREGFDLICDNAVASSFGQSGFDEQAAWKHAVGKSDVRLQWDPDHGPSGNSVERRAVQLGLRGEMLKRYATEWVREITDVTDFVHEQKQMLDSAGKSQLITPVEHVYPAAAALRADEFAVL